MRVVVIGGGAAGLIAAGAAVRTGHEVQLLEQNPRMARKVMITGKGRCNLTNNCTLPELIAHVPTNPRFLYSAFTACMPQDIMALIEEMGVPLKTERGNRVFPMSDKAVDIVDALVKYARYDGKCRFVQGKAAHLQIADGVCTGVQLSDGRTLSADSTIVATGGGSYPQTGSDGSGYQLAREAGHTVTPLRPSLVPLESPASYCGQMQGLSLKNCTLTLEDTVRNKVIFTDFGEMLFTHFGVSGPMVLSASAHMRETEPNRYRLWIDWKPALSAEQLDNRLTRELSEFANHDASSMLRHLLPQKAVPVFLALAQWEGTRKCHAITRAERQRLSALLKRFPVPISGPRPLSEAVVTAGGVAVKEIVASSMASKLVRGLYFAGEILDVDAYTGGFNLQIAFSTGMAAGTHAGK